MARGMYYSGKYALASGDVDWVNSSVSALLVDLSAYTPDLLNDVSLADIPQAARIAEVSLAGKNITPVDIAGEYYAVLRADNATFNSVVDEGQTVTAIILFENARSESETTLLIYNDEAPEFPVTPDGTDIVIYWDTGNDGIYRF